MYIHVIDGIYIAKIYCENTLNRITIYEANE